MKKTSVHLADGRQIIYFDEEDDQRDHPVDRRTLGPLPPPGTLRYDVVDDEWVAIAAHRQDRTHLPAADACPLCPSSPTHLGEIPSGRYDVVVFENRFPSFASAVPLHLPPGEVPAMVERPAAGRCEVVCFTSDHHSSFSALPPARVRTVLEAWVDRTLAMAGLPAVAEVFCFENRGEAIGVTLTHPHGQIYGYPFVAPRTRRRLETARRHQARTGRNLLADAVAGERAARDRIVSSTEYWTAFVPFAARWPVEVHLYPNRQVARLPELDEAERQEFCHVYLDLLGRLEAACGSDVPYVSGWHQAPLRTGGDLAYLHLELSSIRRAPGKVKYLAASEAMMGAFINDIVPEDTARVLREAGTRH
jgi:UDPglucose--hexose-1-phosphate uridylyltransferase